MAQTKTQAWNSVLEIAKNNDFSEEAIADLAEILAPKSSSSAFPPILAEDGTILEAYCRYHKCYEPASDMVISDNKSKGYCKAASSISNARRKEMKELNFQALDIMDDDIKKAKSLRDQAKAIEPTINGSDYYDLESDWETFNAEPTEK